jgi:hypothetical protein
MTEVRELYRELRAAEEELDKWKASEHPSIISECEARVSRAKAAIFAAEGTIRNKD